MRSFFRFVRALCTRRRTPPAPAVYLLELLPVRYALYSDPSVKIAHVAPHRFFAATDDEALSLARRLVPPLGIGGDAQPNVGYFLSDDGSRCLAILYALRAEWCLPGDATPSFTWKHAFCTTWEDACAWFAREPLREGKTLYGPQGVVRTDAQPLSPVPHVMAAVQEHEA